MRSMRTAAMRTVLAALALLLAACTGDATPDPGPTGAATQAPATEGARASEGPTLDGEQIVLASALQPFDSCDGLLDYFKREALKVVGPYGLDGGPMYATDAVAGAAESDSAGNAPGAARSADTPVEGEDFSGTNVQEEGVDEPDSVKTNGEIVVAIARGKLQIVDLADPDRVLSTMALEGWSHELLLDGTRLLVMGTQETNGGPLPASDAVDADASRGGYAPYSPVSVLTMVDISDPADPQVQATLTLDGAYHSSRMIDGVARVVLTSQPTGLKFTYPEGGGLRAERDAAQANRKIIQESTIDNWLPYYVLEDHRGEGEASTSEGTLLDCANVTHPKDFSGLGLLSVLSVDLAGSLTPEGGTAVVASGETIYASAETLYITTNRWVDPVVVADSAPERFNDNYTTEIHAFDITDPTSATYLASGVVKGHLLNQFSMSEHEGLLRVATTDGSPWGGTERSESFVTIFERDGDQLRRVGQVGDLGRGEQIYAVRFLGDVGYVVTFRQTDPLYTLDLADPTKPRVTGELKILGYSAYLHPIGDGLLLGVGQDANRQGMTKGLQLSLFDVSDPAAPRRLQQTRISGGYSDAEYDHRAFLYWPASKLAVVPVQSYSFNQRTQVETFDIGAIAFDVRRRGIGKAGEVRHAPKNDPNAWDGAIRRSMVVGDTLVTISERGLKVSDLSTFSDRAFARFR